MKNDEQRTIKILCIIGIIPVVWLALLMAPFVSGGLAEIVTQFPAAMEHPFQIELCEDSKNTVLIFLLIYALSIGVALSSRRNYRRGEEHGSAKWGSAAAVNRKYQAKDPEANKVFTKHVRMGLDGKKHRRNLNTVVVGGSGSGKSRFYALINLLQACSSYFVLDCKGELLRMTGTFLKMRGYEIKVLDLLSMEKSHCFNPFAYLQTDNDVQKLVTSLFKATTPKGSQSNDPFWDTAASMLLSAIIFYLLYEARRRNVFVSIIIQNIAQLKNLFEKQWESILGNCDEFLYLGGNETGTHKMIAESYLGKQTIDMNTYGKSSGRSGNYSTNWQITGRELLDAAEVRMLDNRYALLFIRGEMPIMDEKYDLLNHPNVRFTPEKGGAPYVHGGTELSVGSLTLTAVTGKKKNYVNLSETEFELLSDEEIEAELQNGGKTNEEHR